MNLKSLILKLRYAFHKPSLTVERKTTTFDQAKKVGLLIYNPDENYNSDINDFIDWLIKEGKIIEIVCFFHKKNPQPCDFPFYSFSKDDLDWKADLKSDKLNNFIKTEFDYLYSINISPFLPLSYFLQRSRAKCRVGNFSNGTANLELVIQLGKDQKLNNLLKQMIIYSKKIKSDE
jgi:hypothetical protein